MPELALPWFDVLPPVDFMLAPVVVDEFIEDEVGCLLLCIFADAAKGEAARPAITSVAIVSLLFIMWNSSLDHTGGNRRRRARFQTQYEGLIAQHREERNDAGDAQLSRTRFTEGAFAWN
jgi:hypothetical protein